jgi:hypothetical protein
MRKYAAATALAIALITMLTLTVSASASCGGALLCYCGRKCNIELFNTPTLTAFMKGCGFVSQEHSVTCW